MPIARGDRLYPLAAGVHVRPRGRPRREIDLDAVAEAVSALLAEGGYDAVSVNSAAEKLEVSRATLYRTVPNKEQLLGILFERGTRDLTRDAQQVAATRQDARDQLHQLIALQIEAAVRMRQYMPVFYGGAGLPPDVFARWHSWSRQYEGLWVGTISRAMEAKVLQVDDPVVTTRLLLGMCIWVSRWFRVSDEFDTDEIADCAITLLYGSTRPTRH